MTAAGSANVEGKADRAAGTALVAAAALSVLAMAHHPTGAHAQAGLAALVHGAMIALVAVMMFGFAQFARRRGLAFPLVLAGLSAYALSAGAHVAAATINGFIVPALAAREANHDLFLLSWEANQAFARLGVFATSAAFLLWSGHLFLGRARLLAAAGFLAGLAPCAALAAGAIEMDVAGAFIVYAAHAAFAAFVGVELLRGRL